MFLQILECEEELLMADITPPPTKGAPLPPKKVWGKGKQPPAPLPAMTTYQQSIVSALDKVPDEDEHFLLSLAPSMRRLCNKKALARMSFQQILLKLEFGEIWTHLSQELNYS